MKDEQNTAHERQVRWIEKLILTVSVTAIIAVGGAYVDFRIHANEDQHKFEAIKKILEKQTVDGVPFIHKILTNTEFMRGMSEQIGSMYNQLIKQLDIQHHAIDELKEELGKHRYGHDVRDD